MPSKRSCCVFGCNNSDISTYKISPKVIYYGFPWRPWKKDRRSKWVQFVKREGSESRAWKPTKNNFICSQHFVGNRKSEDPRSPSFNPTIHPLLRRPPNNLLKSARYARFLKRSAATPVVVNTCPLALHQEPVIAASTDNISQHSDSISSEAADLTRDQVIQTSLSSRGGMLTEFYTGIFGNDKSTQVQHGNQDPTEPIVQKQFTEKASGSSTRTSVFCGYDTIQRNEKSLKNLTAVSTNVFSLLLNMLPRSTPLTYEMTWENKLLLFLTKLKTNSSFLVLGTMFDVHPSTASNTFHFILSHLCHVTRSWIFWPSKHSVQATMPLSFRENYPNSRTIIDCTEIKTESSPGVAAQVQMYSQYKGTWTVKYLIGTTPGGFISFISKGYGGRSTDVFITNNCGILTLLEPGDIILADKGFPNIQTTDNTILVMPPFAEPLQTQFSKQKMEETYKVASVRIHVERAIQRVKIFKILENRLSIDLIPYIDDIVHMCCVLVNFQAHIIKSNCKVLINNN